MKKIYIGICLLAAAATHAQQPVPVAAQTGKVIISGATIHLGNGEVIEEGSVSFENGKITAVGKEDFDKNNAQVIDAKGKHVYPGLIAANTILGLSEIEAARATNDFLEVGSMNPNVRAIIAYNTDSKVTPTVRNNGILLAQVVPQAGTISGQSSVVELEGWNWEDAAYRTDEGVHLNWPSQVVLGYAHAEPIEAQKEKSEKNIQAIRTFFKEAKAYHESGEPEEKNLRFEATRGLFSGQKKLYVHTDYVKEMVSAIEMAKEMKVKIVIVGGADAGLITDYLKSNSVEIILNRTHSVPTREGGDVDQAYRLPYVLEQAGIVYTISIEGFWQVRNLPFNAGTAVAYGLNKEQAIKAITLNAAVILGIDKTTGSIEKGKDATLFISTGDALDMRTNNVEQAFVRGKKIQLSNIQQELYEKYKKKYNLN